MKLTQADLENKIERVEYTVHDERMTICLMYMEKPEAAPSQYIVVGKSTCMHPETFDPELGRKYAYQDAVERLWELESYRRLVS